MVVLLSPIQDLPQLSGDGYGTGQHAAEGGQALTGSSSPLLYTLRLSQVAPVLYTLRLSQVAPVQLYIIGSCQS